LVQVKNMAHACARDQGGEPLKACISMSLNTRQDAAVPLRLMRLAAELCEIQSLLGRIAPPH